MAGAGAGALACAAVATPPVTAAAIAVAVISLVRLCFVIRVLNAISFDRGSVADLT
jgi:hypothetical protein